MKMKSVLIVDDGEWLSNSRMARFEQDADELHVEVVRLVVELRLERAERTGHSRRCCVKQEEGKTLSEVVW